MHLWYLYVFDFVFLLFCSRFPGMWLAGGGRVWRFINLIRYMAKIWGQKRRSSSHRKRLKYTYYDHITYTYIGGMMPVSKERTWVRLFDVGCKINLYSICSLLPWPCLRHNPHFACDIRRWVLASKYFVRRYVHIHIFCLARSRRFWAWWIIILFVRFFFPKVPVLLVVDVIRKSRKKMYIFIRINVNEGEKTKQNNKKKKHKYVERMTLILLCS